MVLCPLLYQCCSEDYWKSGRKYRIHHSSTSLVPLQFTRSGNHSYWYLMYWYHLQKFFMSKKKKKNHIRTSNRGSFKPTLFSRLHTAFLMVDSFCLFFYFFFHKTKRNKTPSNVMCRRYLPLVRDFLWSIIRVDTLGLAVGRAFVWTPLLGVRR